MWLGRGFDTNNDGETDFAMWTHVAPMSWATLTTVCLVLGVVLGGMAYVSWSSQPQKAAAVTVAPD